MGDGAVKPEPGFDIERHRRWVASGMCPYVQDKTYCNGHAGHALGHWALYVESNSKSTPVPLPRAQLLEDE